ncbi:metal ABC transporter permease [bacterium]|nr:metal ABC transporter permease [bacterium]
MDGIYHLIGAALPFGWGELQFMQRAIFGVMLLMPLCGAMGVHVVNHRLAFFSETLSHATFTGVAIGLLLSINPSLTLMAFCVAVALAINRVRRRSNLSTDTVVGVIFAVSVALGLAIISAKKELNGALSSFLYGDILSLTDADMAVLLVLFFVVFGTLFALDNRMHLAAVHANLARSRGVRVHLVEDIYAACLALVVAAGIRAVGLLLVTAMLTLPAASARSVARSVGQTFWLATIFAFIAGLAGVVASYEIDIATGAAIILCAAILFALAQIVRAARA